MAVLIDSNTRLIVQGLTGREGTFHAKQCAAYGTNVVGRRDARQGRHAPTRAGRCSTPWPRRWRRTGANASLIFVPPAFAADAVMEAADAGIGLVVCITEGIPTIDMMRAFPFMEGKKTRLIGPNCPGLISAGMARPASSPATSASAAASASSRRAARSPTRPSTS